VSIIHLTEVDVNVVGPAAVAPQKQNAAQRPRILVVDDNADAANTLGRLLTLLGNEVRVVHGGAAALAEIDRFAPRVVLLDLGMPEMDGFTTAQRIRDLPAGEPIAIVAVTGWGQDRDRSRTEAAGFAAHLVKPVNGDELEATLARIIDQNPGTLVSHSGRASSA
jgi:CheY-like chemotaxis protein